MSRYGRPGLVLISVASALERLHAKGLITALPFELVPEIKRVSVLCDRAVDPTREEIAELLDAIGGFPARHRNAIVLLVREELLPGLHASGAPT